jgi:hypothetical protein
MTDRRCVQPALFPTPSKSDAMSSRHLADQSHAARAGPSEPHHVSVGGPLVDEHQSGRVKPTQAARRVLEAPHRAAAIAHGPTTSSSVKSGCSTSASETSPRAPPTRDADPIRLRCRASACAPTLKHLIYRTGLTSKRSATSCEMQHQPRFARSRTSIEYGFGIDLPAPLSGERETAARQNPTNHFNPTRNWPVNWSSAPSRHRLFRNRECPEPG